MLSFFNTIFLNQGLKIIFSSCVHSNRGNNDSLNFQIITSEALFGRYSQNFELPRDENGGIMSIIGKQKRRLKLIRDL